MTTPNPLTLRYDRWHETNYSKVKSEKLYGYEFSSHASRLSNRIRTPLRALDLNKTLKFPKTTRTFKIY